MEVLREVLSGGMLQEHGILVSILVLMEVLREASATGWRAALHPGFNPCFNGSVERGQFPNITLAHDYLFQSLF